MNTKETIPTHMIVPLQKTEEKEKYLKISQCKEGDTLHLREQYQ